MRGLPDIKTHFNTMGLARWGAGGKRIRPPGAGVVRNLGLTLVQRDPGVGNGNPFQYSNLENSRWTKEHGGL